MNQNDKTDKTIGEEEEKDIECCNFNVISQNVKGLREKIKRLSIFEHLKKRRHHMLTRDSQHT